MFRSLIEAIINEVHGMSMEKTPNQGMNRGKMADDGQKKADIKRAIRAVESGGKSVAAVDFPKDGGFRVLIGEPIASPVETRRGANEWDDVLAA